MHGASLFPSKCLRGLPGTHFSCILARLHKTKITKKKTFVGRTFKKTVFVVNGYLKKSKYLTNIVKPNLLKWNISSVLLMSLL